VSDSSGCLRVSVIIPTWNGAGKIECCLNALRNQAFGRPFEVIVVNDGSSDNTLQVLEQFPEVRVVTQANSGPAAARNRGAQEATGDLIVFTDDDCEPSANWLTEMLKPFDDPEIVAAKGAYRTRQTGIVARFVQTEYEDRYRMMAEEPTIDFIDTYSAAFRRDRFIEMSGFDTSFPVASAEDVELSYRMSAKGWKMVFVPAAIVYHRHPDSLNAYVKKKFKFAFWRVLAVKKNPAKAVQDSHTPQLMKAQLLLLPGLIAAMLADQLHFTAISWTGAVVFTFLLTTLPFLVRTFARDRLVGMLSPLLLACRSCAQFLGVVCGATHSLAVSIGTLQPASSREP
jgi:glycosyltransferase involved in cell wall biosynthesis